MSAREIRRNRVVKKNARLFGIGILGATALMLAVLLALYFIAPEGSIWSFLGVVLSIVVLAGVGVMVYLLVNMVARYGSSTERKAPIAVTQSEGKFKALIQNSLDLISIIDWKGTLQYQSPSAERILGYNPDDLIGQSIFELIHSQDHALIQNALDQKANTFFVQIRIQHHDGTWLYFECAGTNLSSNPLIGGIVLNSRDITDRKREEEQRKQKEIAALKFNIEKEKAEREKEIIEQSKKQLEEAYNIIEHKNQEITDSITYAFRIQTALLPPMDVVKNRLPNSFILWRPKDIVSGDFYWAAQIEHLSLVTAADCTGHGVPGAFMTMIGNTLLNQIVLTEKTVMPDEILNNLHNAVRKALKQDQAGSQSRDGMDIAFICVDPLSGVLHYAGANNPLIMVRAGEVTEIKADKKAIGGLQTEDQRIFTLHSIETKPGDMYYVFTDGYEDQFGGPQGRKFMSKRFKKMLGEIAEKPVAEIHNHLEREILDWMGERYEQVDDILVIGVRIS